MCKWWSLELCCCRLEGSGSVKLLKFDDSSFQMADLGDVWMLDGWLQGTLVGVIVIGTMSRSCPKCCIPCWMLGGYDLEPLISVGWDFVAKEACIVLATLVSDSISKYLALDRIPLLSMVFREEVTMYF